MRHTPVRTRLPGLTRRNTHSERADAHEAPGLGQTARLRWIVAGGCADRAAELVFHSEELGVRRRRLLARPSTMRTAAKSASGATLARVPPSKLVTGMRYSGPSYQRTNNLCALAVTTFKFIMPLLSVSLSPLRTLTPTLIGILHFTIRRRGHISGLGAIVNYFFLS